MDIAELREAWPFGGLIDAPADTLASIPVPISRDAALKGDFTVTYASVAPPPTLGELVAALEQGLAGVRSGWGMAMAQARSEGMAQRVAAKLEGPPPDLVSVASAGIDPMLTGSIGAGYGPR